MFHRQRTNPLSPQATSLKNLVRHVAAAQFLADSKRAALLEKMKDLIELEPTRYESLCQVLIENLVNYCQNLPATTNSYYSQPGGLVDHALNRTEAALSLFQEFMVLDASETLSEEQKKWQYTLFSAAILQGIGKLFVDFSVKLFDNGSVLLKQWNPLLESLNSTGSFYHYEFQKESDDDFRRRLNLLLAKALMPASGFAWIASNPEILAVWLALLNEDEGSAGTLGAILNRADSIAIQRYILTYLGKTGGLKSGRYGRAGTFSGGVPETLIEKEQAIGVEVLRWLMDALDEGRFLINQAPLYKVPAGVVMCQEMFQLFVREHPEYKNWQAAQKGFLSLGLHKRFSDGSVLGRFENPHNQQMITGVVFSKYAMVLPETVKLATPSGEKSITATALINQSEYSSQFVQQHHANTASNVQKLNASGTWQTIDTTPSASLNPGVKGA